MNVDKPARPFYSEFAWAFDLLIDRPVRRECGAIATWLVQRGGVPGSTLLDAGCGTGRYAIELARRGYLVHGIDVSRPLLEQARRALGTLGKPTPGVTFAAADLLELTASQYHGILCRGVLNDIVDDAARASAFASFRRVLCPRGVLVLDVREWEATASRKTQQPLFRKRVETERGRLTYTSVTELDPATHRLIVKERHTLEAGGRERSSDYEFVMRCWTREELQSLLGANGFRSLEWFGAYDPAIPPGATDRIVAVGQVMA